MKHEVEYKTGPSYERQKSENFGAKGFEEWSILKMWENQSYGNEKL